MVENTERTRQLKTKTNLNRATEKTKKGKNGKYNICKKTRFFEDDIKSLTSEITTLTGKFQMIVFTGQKNAVDHSKVH